MVALEDEEVVVVRKYLKLGERTSGSGTEEHEACVRVLTKLEEAVRRRDQPHRRPVPGPSARE